MSSGDVGVPSPQTTPSDSHRLPPGELVYEYTPQVTEIVEYGASAAAMFARESSPPTEGARFDLHLEGRVTGPRLNGTLKGIDYLNCRADGRAELHIHATITTDDGKRIALSAGGVATGEGGSSVFQLREYAVLTTNHKDLAWVNAVQIWASGEVDVSTGQVRVRGYAV